MRRPVFLSTFLFAALLSPVVLQSNTCTPAGNAKLAILELRVGSATGENMIKNFSPNVIMYQALMPASEAIAVLRAEPQDPSATIEVRHDGQLVPFIWDGYTTLSVPLGASELTIKVSVNTAYSWTYTVSIQRGDLCEGVACDDHNECTEDLCNSFNGVCKSTPVPDGSPCGGETDSGNPRGGCYEGLCNFVPVTTIVGSREVVFDWSADRCEDLDIPDGPARAVRAESGEIVLFGTIHESGNYLSRGVDFGSLVHDCEHPAHRSTNLPTPESYENNEWLWSPYREGEYWHVLIHNEFHDQVDMRCQDANCVYNSITYAVSTDEAYSFVKPSPPMHVVAPAPDVWTAPGPETPPQPQYVEGYSAPSNIVRGPDDYYYALFWAYPHYEDVGATAGHECLMRTSTLGDPASWRAWDGDGFNLPMPSPYASGGEVESCGALETLSDAGNLGNMNSLTYNTYLERYMWVAEHSAWKDGELVCGVYFTTSFDLIHWSEVQLIAEAILWCDPPTTNGLEPVRIQYPSIIDHADSTTNFEQPGRSAYLYYTRHNGGLDRDLVRVPVTFTMGGPLCEGVNCDDQDACTEDLCNGADGSCEHRTIVCIEDFNDCTLDACDPSVGCNPHVANGTPCAGGICQEGVCQLTSSVLPCTEQGLRNAIAMGGGPYTFSCAGPTTVVTQAEIVIDNDVILDGAGELTIDGNESHRVFSVAAGTTSDLVGFTITRGSTTENGGGILNAGALTLTNSVVSGNVADGNGGGIRNDGALTFVNSTASGNIGAGGGGFYVSDAGILIAANSTVSGNTSFQSAAGIDIDGAVTLTNCTVSGNTADRLAGGIFVGGGASLVLVNSTVSGNTANYLGGGIVNNGSLALANSIVSGNSGDDCLHEVASLGYNLESPGNTCGFDQTGDQSGVPASLLNLGPLADNGGPTMTHALGAGSVAIDQIPEADCVDPDGQSLTTDQRGEPRPEPGGTRCDVGAFEVQP